MSFESLHGPESFGPEKHKKEAKPDTLEVPEEMQKITEQIRDWWFGSRSKEAEKKQDETKETEKEEETKEAKEKKEVAEKIVTKRGGLFQRVTERIMEEREKSAEEIENMPEGQRKAYELMKKIPLVRSGFVIMEGLSGAEPGKKLNTKDALVKIGTGYLMFGADIFGLIAKLKTGKIPENVFAGKTLETIDSLADKAKEENPESKKTIAFGALNDFLKENREVVSYCEDQLNEITKREVLKY